VQGVRERRLALLEADTDGVFFAVPDQWSEDDERACVAAIAATLPTGIGLQYEGRYRAMLSHEVKNYALLTYDDRLIVRGNAFQSSRTEPFGAQFLLAALRCLLVGDTPGVQRVFLDTVAAVRGRRFAPAEMATVARLTKTHDEYIQTRQRSREAAYEALLNSGRTQWRAGERVRFYRAADGTAVWLPDESGEAASQAPASDDAAPRAAPSDDRAPDYDVAHYLAALHASYVTRLRKAFAPADFEQLFRLSGQLGLFDRPVEEVQPEWIRA